MAPKTAAKLAKRLLQVHVDCVNFFFELDTAENASLLANAFRALGCGVLLDASDFRLNIFLPLHKRAEHDLPSHAKKTALVSPLAIEHQQAI
jgi:hypothetical protein